MRGSIRMLTFLENKTFNEIKLGDTSSFTRQLSQQDIQVFSIISGDINPAHIDEEYAKTDIFHKTIAHGMWTGSLISTVLGTLLPGPGTIYLEQSLKFLKPVSPGDFIKATVVVIEKNEEKHKVKLACRCENKNREIVLTGSAEVLAPIEKIKRIPIDLPNLELKPPRKQLHDILLSKTKGLAPIRVAVVHPTDEHSLEGALVAARENLITPILIGPIKKMNEIAARMNVDLSNFELIATEHSHESIEKAIELTRIGKAEALMKGKTTTDELMGAIVAKASGLRTERRVSHVFVMDIPSYHKPLFITDAAVNISPSLSDKKDIIQNVIELFQVTMGGIPKIAIISATEEVNEKIPSTLDATALCKMSERGQIVGGILDGPLAFDNAISKEAATTKGIVSQVAGDADIIIAPNLETGNVLYKQLCYFSGAEGAGIVLGTRVPLILTSRASHQLTRKLSSILALLWVRNRTKT